MKAHVAKFFQFLEDKEGKNAPLRVKLLNPDKYKITKDDLNVKGNLNLSDANIKSLPEGLRVGNDLDLSNCTSLTSLPNGLHIGEALYLTNCTSLKSLPDNLYVGGTLLLADCTSLTSLPTGLKVGRHLNLRYTPLAEMYNTDEIRDMIKATGGYVGMFIFI